MPNSEHGYSPHELIYGMRSRTPLEALYYGLNDHEGAKMKMSKWIDGIADRLQLIREEAALAAEKTVERRKELYDKNSKLRELEVGERVRYRIPGMHSALSESWDGFFYVQKKYGKVNYRIQRVGVKSAGKVTHINNFNEICR